MVVDSSVLLQLLFAEPKAAATLNRLDQAAELLIAAPTLLETEIVYGAKHGFDSGNVGELAERLNIEVVAFAAEHAREARLAYARFGKGQGSPAQLNFGDCVSYALAKVTGQPLAYKGEDFVHTDLDLVKLG